MRRHLAILLVLALGLLPSCATAQWYRFPGKKKTAPRDTVSATVPAADSTALPDLSDGLRDTLAAQPGVFVPDIPEVVKLSLLLPLGAGNNPSGNFFEFYCGALLAARDLGNEGISMELSALDITDSANLPGSWWTVSGSDVIIGPVSPADISAQLRACPDGKYLVSPLDQRVAAMSDSLRVIHAISSWEDQVDDLVEWIIRERKPGGTVVVVCNSDEDTPQSGLYLMDRLAQRGVRYERISYGILQGLTILESFEYAIESRSSLQLVIASENEAFTGDVVRNAGLLKFRGKDVLLYAPAKVRSMETIDTDTFFEVGMRVSGTYFIDYESPEVKKFVLAYRALFGAEPGNFAFSGYDVTNYFTRLCHEYGRGWRDKIHEFEARGLQTDFRFEDSASVGRRNRAVRRMVYNPDYTISLID